MITTLKGMQRAGIQISLLNSANPSKPHVPGHLCLRVLCAESFALSAPAFVGCWDPHLDLQINLH